MCALAPIPAKHLALVPQLSVSLPLLAGAHARRGSRSSGGCKASLPALPGPPCPAVCTCCGGQGRPPRQAPLSPEDCRRHPFQQSVSYFMNWFEKQVMETDSQKDSPTSLRPVPGQSHLWMAMT